MNRSRVLICLAGTGLVAVLACGFVLPRAWPDTAELARHVEATLDGAGVWGPLALMVGQVLIAASGVLPASLLGLAAGAMYGVASGFSIVAISTVGGAYLTFRLSRSLFRAPVERLLARRSFLADLDARVARERWRLVCLLRLSPVMPFAATSYALGLSGVRERDYLLGTLFSLPALLGYVVLGRLAWSGIAAGVTGANTLQWALLGAGIVATVAATVSVGRLIARSMRHPGLN